MPQVIPPSPAAMELAKYTAYPVNLSNGLVQISIPFYEIVDGDIRIPLARVIKLISHIVICIKSTTNNYFDTIT
jgi:hypothetical protein